MQSVQMIKKANFLAAQGKENLPTNETVTVFTPEEIAKLKVEASKQYSTGKKLYKQAGAFILMLNTGLRAGEVLGLINSDVDLENRVLHVQRGVKRRNVRDGYAQVDTKMETVVGKLKSASSKRDVPLNDTAIQAIKEMREEIYLGEDCPLIPDIRGEHLNPERFRRRYYRLLDGVGVEHRGLHSLRHTFATNLVNGVK